MMCGRYTLRIAMSDLAESFALEGQLPPFGPSYNVAPSREIPAIVGTDGRRSVELLTWGLVPHWSREFDPGPINARAETVAERPSFRRAFSERRVLIPADGYYEWKKTSGPKQPYYFTVQGGEPFAFAGISSLWVGSEGEAFGSCAIITTTPNELAAEVHHRMPVILESRDWDAWLDPTSDKQDMLSLLNPYPSAEMETYRVDTQVNRPTNDDPSCVEPVSGGRA